MTIGPFAVVEEGSEEIYGMGKTRERAVKEAKSRILEVVKEDVEQLAEEEPLSSVVGGKFVLVETRDYVLERWRGNGYGCVSITDGRHEEYHATDQGW